jgi:hypothetical protein
MDCAAVKPRMEALVNGSLPESERSLAEQHIAACEGCRLELELVRAIGSQEKAPAVGKDDWTLDRIFGTEKNSSGASPAPSAESAILPLRATAGDAAAESLFGPAICALLPLRPRRARPGRERRGDAAPMGKRAGSAPAGASWDFEPADAGRMPSREQSLFFAAERSRRRTWIRRRAAPGDSVGAGVLSARRCSRSLRISLLHMERPLRTPQARPASRPRVEGDDHAGRASATAPGRPAAGEQPSDRDRSPRTTQLKPLRAAPPRRRSSVAPPAAASGRARAVRRPRRSRQPHHRAPHDGASPRAHAFRPRTPR